MKETEVEMTDDGCRMPDVRCVGQVIWRLSQVCDHPLSQVCDLKRRYNAIKAFGHCVS